MWVAYSVGGRELLGILSSLAGGSGLHVLLPARWLPGFALVLGGKAPGARQPVAAQGHVVAYQHGEWNQEPECVEGNSQFHDGADDWLVE